MAVGVVVAGGRSTRFGDEDKALAPLAGVPMVRRVADRLAAAERVGGLLLNCRADQRAGVEAAMEGAGPPVAYAEDPAPDRGPLAGMLTALRAAEAEYAFVAACDMPFLDPGLVDYLLTRAAGRDAAVPVVAGHRQPLHAAYRAAPAADACERALGSGDRRADAPLSSLDAAFVAEEDLLARGAAASFENLNTREAFAAAAERF